MSIVHGRDGSVEAGAENWGLWFLFLVLLLTLIPICLCFSYVLLFSFSRFPLDYLVHCLILPFNRNSGGTGFLNFTSPETCCSQQKRLLRSNSIPQPYHHSSVKLNFQRPQQKAAYKAVLHFLTTLLQLNLKTQTSKSSILCHGCGTCTHMPGVAGACSCVWEIQEGQPVSLGPFLQWGHQHTKNEEHWSVYQESTPYF